MKIAGSKAGVLGLSILVAELAAAAPLRESAPAFAAALARSEYHYSLGDGSATAPNRARRLRTTLRGDGLLVESRGGDGGPLLRLRAMRFGSGDALEPVPDGQVRTSGARAEILRADVPILEWIENREREIEHGYTIERPPGQGGDGRLVLELGVDTPFRTEVGERSIRFFDDAGALRLRYEDLKVFDALGRVLPARFAARAGNRVGVEVDARDARYPITIDPIVTGEWSSSGDQPNAHFGAAVATAGDVDGDGYSDVLVGAPDYDAGQVDEGAVFLYRGSAAGLETTYALRLEGNVPGARFGALVAPAGDIDHDGRGDVLVGAPGWSSPEPQEGRLFVYLGQSAAPFLLFDVGIEGNQVGAHFGASAATAGDVNADGFDDVVAGAPGWSNGQSGEGRALFFRGAASGLVTFGGWSLEGDEIDAALGTSVSGAGDLNADGFADVVVGCPGCSNGQSGEGRVFVHHGSAFGLSAQPNAVRESGQIQAAFGASVANAGDVDGDGYADLLIGAPHFDAPEIDEGRAFLYRGSSSGLEATPFDTLESNEAHAQLGSVVATAGDWNADGYADVLIGAPLQDYSSFADVGFVYLLRGTTAGLTANAGDPYAMSGDGFGIAVASAGDVNGDGFGDYLIGVPGADDLDADEGAVFVEHGRGLAPAFTGALLDGPESDQSGALLGLEVAVAGDVNGDGFEDLLVAAPNYYAGEVEEGRVWLYLGARGGPLGPPALIADGNQVGARFGSALDGAGDVNGDGYDDFLVGAPGYSSGEGGEGRAFLFGGAPGPPFQLLWSGESNQVGAAFGSAVAGAGDANGDGYGDLLIGAPSFDGGQTDEGRVSFYFGSPSGPSPTPFWSIEGNQAGARFGAALASGDFDRDGYADLVISAPDFDAGETDEGRAFVHRGGPGGPAIAPSWSAGSDQAGARFGTSVAATDSNDDGFSDVAVGAPFFDGEDYDTNDQGRVFVYHGASGGPSPTASVELTPDFELLGQPVSTDGAEAGAEIAAIGDVDGDGYGDLAVGGPGFLGKGAAGIFFGSPTGFETTIGWFYYSLSNAPLGVGRALAGGDLDGDGISDLVIGMPLFDGGGQPNEGRFAILHGNASAIGGVLADHEQEIRARQRRGPADAPIALLGRSEDPDRFTVAAIARTLAGRGEVRLVVQVAPLAAPLEGAAAVVTPWTSTDAPGPGGSVAKFEVQVGPIPSGVPHHWRLRVETRSPFFPRSRWVSPAGNTASEQDLRMRPVSLPACDDGQDNDRDGLVDTWRDTGCTSPGDPSELVECEDGLDNDGDGAIDLVDAGCNLAQLASESPQCSNGIDDEGDGAVDHPADPHCNGPWDPKEKANPSCGLGAELAWLLALVALRSRHFGLRRLREPQSRVPGTE